MAVFTNILKKIIKYNQLMFDKLVANLKQNPSALIPFVLFCIMYYSLE